MSIFSDMMGGPGFDQLAGITGDSFDYHPAGGSEVEAIVGLVETRARGNEVVDSRYDETVEVIRVTFKNSATLGVATPARGDYITDAGADVRFYFHEIIEDNTSTRLLLYVRNLNKRTGPGIGSERQYR